MDRLFETIEYKGLSFSLFSIILYGTLFLVVLVILIICNGIKKAKDNKVRFELEKHLIQEHGKRMLCSNCPHCKKRLDKPFYTRYDLASWRPSYCKRFRMRLPTGPVFLVCQAKDPNKAMRTSDEQK